MNRGRGRGPDEPSASPEELELDGVDVPVDGPETVAENRLLATFGRRARAVNLARVVRLTELLDTLDMAGAATTTPTSGPGEEERLEAETLAHQIVGSAGTFGFPAASAIAVRIEDYFADPAAATVDDVAAVRRALDELHRQFDA